MALEPASLGRYVIEEVLGRGAMGVVYLGRDPVIGRRLAIKTLHLPAEAEEAEEFRQRFLREAQAAGILNHPGIVTVHDAGVDDASGLSFMVMEFIEGKSLKDLLKGGHMFAYSEVARIGAALAGALDYAHSRGVVHRDIKPANIVLTPQGAVKITDFGVARLESSNLTATGQFIGTPNYMSPEQVNGSAIDGRSDLFSLGVVLFELMTGTRPFVGSTLTEVTYKIVHEPPPIPSMLRPGLPPAFNPIVLKLLEKEAPRRYQRGADVARALEALRRVLAGLAGEVTQDAAPAPEASRQPPSMSAAPTATRATLLVEPPPEPYVAVTAPSPPAPPPWRLAIHPRWVATLLAAAALPPVLAIAVLLARLPGPASGPPPGEPLRRHRVAAAQRRAAAALLAGHPEEAERALSEVWDQAPYGLAARQLRQTAVELRSRQAAGRENEERARRLKDEGRGLLHQGRLREAYDRFAEALELTPDDAVAREYLDVAQERARLPRTGRAEPAIPRASATIAAPTAARGTGRVELYFNSPLPAGTIEVELDGASLARKVFSFYQKSFIGIKRKGTGVVGDAYTMPAGDHTLVVRLLDEDGELRGEQVMPLALATNARVSLKIDMEGERDSPRFTLTPVRAR